MLHMTANGLIADAERLRNVVVVHALHLHAHHLRILSGQHVNSLAEALIEFHLHQCLLRALLQGPLGECRTLHLARPEQLVDEVMVEHGEKQVLRPSTSINAVADAH